MNHASMMSIVYSIAYGCQDAGSFLGGKGLPYAAAFTQFSLQGGAFNEFHDHVKQIALMVKVYDLHDVGMPQFRHCFGFSLKAPDKVFFFGQERVQGLDGHVAVQPRLIHFVDVSHSASSQAFYDLIFADRFANFQCHLFLLVSEICPRPGNHNVRVQRSAFSHQPWRGVTHLSSDHWELSTVQISFRGPRICARWSNRILCRCHSLR